jgi:hypothetical protein
MTDLERNLAAEKLLRFFVELMTVSVLSVVASAISSPQARLTYERAIQDSDILPDLFMNLLLHLRMSPPFPETLIHKLIRRTASDAFARSILRRIVVGHFYLFPVDREVRTRVLGALGVRYPQKVGANQRAMLTKKQS